MKSVYLRLAAPLQSWATARVTGNVVRTQPRPTFDGIRGLVAASLGAYRGQWPSWLNDLEISVRTEAEGALQDEFQTINPRTEDIVYQQRMYQLLTGKKWTKSAHFTPDGQSTTSIVRRTYLADAEFLIEIGHEEHVSTVAAALRRPVFTTYLGRKAFSPTFPYYLGLGNSGLLKTLPTALRADDTTPGHTTRPLRIDTASSWQTVEVPMSSRQEWLDIVGGQLDRSEVPTR